MGRVAALLRAIPVAIPQQLQRCQPIFRPAGLSTAGTRRSHARRDRWDDSAICVCPVPGKGLGVRASRALAKGEVLLSEAPLARIPTSLAPDDCFAPPYSLDVLVGAAPAMPAARSWCTPHHHHPLPMSRYGQLSMRDASCPLECRHTSSLISCLPISKQDGWICAALDRTGRTCSARRLGACCWQTPLQEMIRCSSTTWPLDSITPAGQMLSSSLWEVTHRR